MGEEQEGVGEGDGLDDGLDESLELDAAMREEMGLVVVR